MNGSCVCCFVWCCFYYFLRNSLVALLEALFARLLTRYWGIVTVPGCPRVNRSQMLTWGGQILTLHLNYVAGYTGPLLFLFERTHNYYVNNQGLVPWRLRRLGRSKVRSASLVKVLSDGKISWILWSQGLWNPPPPTTEQTNTFFFKNKEEKSKPEGKGPSPEKSRTNRQFFAFENYWTWQWACWPRNIAEPRGFFWPDVTHMTGRIWLARCHTYELVMSTKLVGHVIQTNESCHTCEGIMSHIWMRHDNCVNASWHTHDCVMSHLWMRHVSHVNKACRTSKNVMREPSIFDPITSQNMSHVRMSHFTRMDGYCHTRGCDVSYIDMTHMEAIQG